MEPQIPPKKIASGACGPVGKLVTITGKGILGKPESPIQGSRGSLDNGTRESYREIVKLVMLLKSDTSG